MIQTAFSSTMAKDNIIANLIAVCPDGIIGVDLRGTVVIFNAKAAALTRRKSEDVLGCLDIGQIYGSREQARRIKAALNAEDFGGIGRLDGFETAIVDIDNKAIPIRLSAALILDNGNEVGSVGFFHDLTNQKIMEEKLHKLSITDGLTNLFNQRYFHSCLADEMDRVTRYNSPLSLICFDLDKFKDCNDRLGHLEGDNVLRRVGNLLNVITRRTDKCFRYGGDEFFVLLPETNLDQAMIAAEKIRQMFNDSWPYETSGTGALCRVTLSVGVVQRKEETSGVALMKRADVAMYNAKNQGGNSIVAG
ncbi:MAG: sensor domain-containing diguanylate cyclase [Deltaproteobacteria bacterium]|nr:sensor domain-containing diguanylate cyclase [Deltaproteobacteria bacterium]